MMQATDVDLVERALAGDKDAFGDLVRKHQGLVYGLAYHRVEDFADAQDIAEDVFVKVFRCLGQVENPERFGAWLRTITANECTTWLRRRQHVMSLEEAEMLASHAALAAEKSRQREQRAEILQAVDSLPEKSRLMVTLHYLSGLSCREIGESIGMSANAVAQHLHRARQQLKEMMMAEIEEGYAMNRLPESFTQEVLERVTLCPIVEGKFVTSRGEGDVFGLMMGVGERGTEESLITLWMRRDDLDGVVLGLTPGRSAQMPKGRAFESALQILDAFGIELKQVVLRLSDTGRCRASVDLKQGGTELTLDMRPSDALGLAVRVKAPIYAEEPVVQRGNVGEDDVPAPEEHMDSDAFKTELGAQHQVDLLRDKAFEVGLSLSAEDLVDTVRYRVDEAAGTVRMWIEAIREQEVTLSLKEYEAGVQKLWELARNRHNSGLLRDGKSYKVYYAMLDEDVRVRVMQDEADDRWPASAL